MGTKAKAIRDVSPFLQKVRDFLLGRRFVRGLRFTDDVASRSPPDPNLPDGPSHRLNANYYYMRDARREVKPPLLVAGLKQIAATSSKHGPPTGSRPGNVHHWD